MRCFFVHVIPLLLVFASTWSNAAPDFDAPNAIQKVKLKMRQPVFQEREFNENDLERIRKLGNGAFGTVDLYQNKQSGELFAVKNVSVESGADVNQEIQMLKECDNQFIMKYYGELPTAEPSRRFLVFQFIHGVSLTENWDNYVKRQKHRPHLFASDTDLKMPLEYVRFYIATILSGLRYMEKLYLVHGDVKPDNVMVGTDGFPMLVDFGLARRVFKNDAFVGGSPIYAAPEIFAQRILAEGVARKRMEQEGIEETPENLKRLRREELKKIQTEAGTMVYGRYTDMWSIGVMTYRLLTGNFPFCTDYEGRVVGNYVSGEDRYRYTCFSEDPIGATLEDRHYQAFDFIDRLLQPHPADRLGYKGVKEVMNHKFFKDVNWEAIKKKTATAPPMNEWNPKMQIETPTLMGTCAQ